MSKITANMFASGARPFGRFPVIMGGGAFSHDLLTSWHLGEPHLIRPGMLLVLKDRISGDARTVLVGNVNTDLGVCSCCKDPGSEIIAWIQLIEMAPNDFGLTL